MATSPNKITLNLSGNEKVTVMEVAQSLRDALELVVALHAYCSQHTPLTYLGACVVVCRSGVLLSLLDNDHSLSEPLRNPRTVLASDSRSSVVRETAKTHSDEPK